MRRLKGFLLLTKIFALLAVAANSFAASVGETKPAASELSFILLESVNLRCELRDLKNSANSEKSEILSQIASLESFNAACVERAENLRKKNAEIKTSISEISKKLESEKNALANFDAFLQSKFNEISKISVCSEELAKHANFLEKSASQKLTSLFLILENLKASDEKDFGIFLEIENASALKSLKSKSVVEIEVKGAAK